MQTEINSDGKVMYCLGPADKIDHDLLGLKSDGRPSWYIKYKDNTYWCEEKFAKPYIERLPFWRDRLKKELEKFKSEDVYGV